jgi:hypothetical protein
VVNFTNVPHIAIFHHEAYQPGGGTSERTIAPLQDSGPVFGPLGTAKDVTFNLPFLFRSGRVNQLKCSHDILHEMNNYIIREP